MGRVARGESIIRPMRVFRGLGHAALAPPCALTIGNFDGVHRGHQAMLALLVSEARHRGLPSRVLTFEPHPRDWFARLAGREAQAPPRIATLRDRMRELARCGVDQVVVMRFDRRLASMSPEAFVDTVLVAGLHARYVLVGDDFRFGAKRAGDYAVLDALGDARGFDVARMQSYEVHGTRVSSSAVRAALAAGDMAHASALLGHPHTLAGRVVHGRKLGRDLGCRTLNLRFPGTRSAAEGIFVAQVEGLGPLPGRSRGGPAPSGVSERSGRGGAPTPRALPAVASLGRRPTVDDAGRVLLEVHCLEWPDELGLEGGYGRCVEVTLLHKLHDERRYESMDALRTGIAADTEAARTWWHARPRS
jgi:riboflavin kinase / FMN adenylyltransferase